MKQPSKKRTTVRRQKPEQLRPEPARTQIATPVEQSSAKVVVSVPKKQLLLTTQSGVEKAEPASAVTSKAAVAPKATETSRLTRFEFYAPDARLVCLAGSFNQWNPAVTPMTRMAEGNWVKDLPLAPGHHEYQFVLDGKWTPDLKAKDAIPNAFGGFNSVVEV